MSMHWVIRRLVTSPNSQSYRSSPNSTAITVIGKDNYKGAFTRHRLRQMIFGGATSHIMHHADLPLMAH
jgi:hypothetical protein